MVPRDFQVKWPLCVLECVHHALFTVGFVVPLWETENKKKDKAIVGVATRHAVAVESNASKCVKFVFAM